MAKVKNGSSSIDERIKKLERQKEKLTLQKQIADLRAKQKALK
jgi:hypothetical protein